jgi:hypothetical protein
VKFHVGSTLQNCSHPINVLRGKRENEAALKLVVGGIAQMGKEEFELASHHFADVMNFFTPKAELMERVALPLKRATQSSDIECFGVGKNVNYFARQNQFSAEIKKNVVSNSEFKAIVSHLHVLGLNQLCVWCI